MNRPHKNQNLSENQGLAEIIDSLRDVSELPFESAVPPPPSINRSSDFFNLEKANVFSKEWICVGRQEEWEQPGSYRSTTIADVPVLIVRQKSGELQAFLNVCAHRRARIVPDDSGTAKKFTCPYHAWTYNIAGKLVAAPYMDMKSDFQRCDHSLKPVSLCIWEGFVYVCLSDRSAENFRNDLKPFTDNVVGRFDMSCYRTVITDTMCWKANWKNLIENFTESYHVPIAHQKTFAKHGKPLTDYICGEDSLHYCYHRAPQEASTGLGAAHPDNDRLEGEWRRMMVDFCIFPNHLVTLMPDYVWWISVQPEGHTEFRAEWGVAFPPEVLEEKKQGDFESWLIDFKEYMDIANDEDKLLVEALYQGSVYADPPIGTYHPIERNLWQFNRYLSNAVSSQI
ncbi:MAG: SRPBCC family protein [Pseudomonadota bacterium]